MHLYVHGLVKLLPDRQTGRPAPCTWAGCIEHDAGTCTGGCAAGCQVDSDSPSCTPTFAWACRHVHKDAGVLQMWTRASEQHWLTCTALRCGLTCSRFPQQGVCNPLERLKSRERQSELSQPLSVAQDLHNTQVCCGLPQLWLLARRRIVNAGA